MRGNPPDRRPVDPVCGPANAELASHKEFTTLHSLSLTAMSSAPNDDQERCDYIPCSKTSTQNDASKRIELRKCGGCGLVRYCVRDLESHFHSNRATDCTYHLFISRKIVKLVTGSTIRRGAKHIRPVRTMKATTGAAFTAACLSGGDSIFKHSRRHCLVFSTFRNIHIRNGRTPLTSSSRINRSKQRPNACESWAWTV